MTAKTAAHDIPQQVRNLLRGFDVDTVVNSPNVCYIIDADLRLVYVNEAFHRFATENGAPGLAERFGLERSILDAISGPQRAYYDMRFRAALGADSVEPIDYECSSPGRYREYQLLLYPLRNHAGLLVEHSLRHSGEHTRNASPFDAADYRDQHGIIHQCGHCRRVQNMETAAYDWCPDAFAAERVSHGLCPYCLDFYYPDE